VKDIVEDALQHTGEREAKDSLNDDMFLFPTCGIIRCGLAGIDRIKLSGDPIQRWLSVSHRHSIDG